MKNLYDEVSVKCSKEITKKYSTSFSLGIRLLGKKLRNPVYSIYGFVRLADEIVDTFHDYDKRALLEDFEKETFTAIENKISLNPILNSFQQTVHEYGISREHIKTFLNSMYMDLDQQSYSQEEYEKYILGSAEVVGLMCLRVFCEGDCDNYNHLKPYAKKLGAAFQKINFLRDINQDYNQLGRVYFPGVNFEELNADTKKQIEADIKADFDFAYKGIVKLPKPARMGVYLAYIYYLQLFKKIQATDYTRIMQERIRVPNKQKATLLVQSYVKHNLNLM